MPLTTNRVSNHLKNWPKKSEFDSSPVKKNRKNKIQKLDATTIRTVRKAMLAERTWVNAKNYTNADIDASMKEMAADLRPVDFSELLPAGVRGSLVAKPAEKHLNLRSVKGLLVASGLAASLFDVRSAEPWSGRVKNTASQQRIRREAVRASETDEGTSPPLLHASGFTTSGLPLSLRRTQTAALLGNATINAKESFSLDAGVGITPPESPLASVLKPAWIDDINWRAFDEAGFLRACGVQLDERQGLAGKLHAMHACFPPQVDGNALPLDIRQFDQTRIARFVAGVMATIGPDEMSHQAQDPVFSQNLFKRWFLQLASPVSSASSDIDGHYIAPFNAHLLGLIRQTALHRHKCSEGSDSAAFPLLPRISVLKSDLREKYLLSYKAFGRSFSRNWEAEVDPARSWAFEGLCELFEPTLMRKDLPENFRYGSLNWALLAIGIDLAGDSQTEMNAHELILLGGATDIFFESPNKVADGIRQKAVHIILKMAHAQGKIDLLDRFSVTEEKIELALDTFHTQLMAEGKKLAPLDQLIARLPTRGTIAQNMLREYGFAHPDRQISNVQPLSHHRSIQLWSRRERHCMPESKSYPLYQVFMSNCLKSRSGIDLTRDEKTLLRASGLTHRQLTLRFEKDFNDHLKPLTHEVMKPALQELIETMDEEDEKFWRCGEWMVRIPTVSINTERASGLHVKAAIGVGQTRSTVLKNTAQDSVLIRLALGQGRQQEIRTYWATLTPFELRRYTGADQVQLEMMIHTFFKPLKDGDKLLNLNRHATPAYEDFTVGNVEGDLLQTISERLLHHRIGNLREFARETTQPELVRQRLREMLLDLLPLYSCVKAIRAGEQEEAALYCTLDAFSLIPTVFASAKLGKAVFDVGKSLTRTEIKQVAQAFMLRNVKSVEAHRSLSTLLRLNKPVIDFVKSGVRLFDPGVELLHGLGALSFRLGVAGMQRLTRRLHDIAELRRIAIQLEAAEQLALKCYPEQGFWRARPAAITVIRGQARMVLPGREYKAFSIGGTDNVLAIGDGTSFRLANPQSGLGYGPLMQQSAIPGQLELVSVTNRKNVIEGRSWLASITHSYAGLCRVKRAGDIPVGACQLIVDTRFGVNGYARQYPPLISYMQFRLVERMGYLPRAGALSSANFDDDANGLQMVNAGDLGYSSYAESAVGQRSFSKPDESVLFVHTLSASGDAGISSDVPYAMHGYLAHRPQGGSNTGADYVVFTTSVFVAETGTTIYTTRYVPFGSYQERNGDFIGIAYCDPQTAYRFRIDQHDLPLKGTEPEILLRRAYAAEIDRFNQFQALLALDVSTAYPLVANAVKLGQQTNDVQIKFSRVLERSTAILNDAISAMTHQKEVVERIFIKFLGIQEKNEKFDTLLDAVRHRLIFMRHAMFYLKEQSPDVIGFFDGGMSDSGMSVVANTFVNSMKAEIGFQYINKPIITFEKNYFMSPALIDNHAATLIHEYSHALFDTRDAMDPITAEPVYAMNNDEEIRLLTITEAAQLFGSQPENHAPTLEHLTMMMAYLMEDKTKDTVMQYLQFSDAYTRMAMKADLNALHDMRR